MKRLFISAFLKIKKITNSKVDQSMGEGRSHDKDYPN
jgi:hypothetical protein